MKRPSLHIHTTHTRDAALLRLRRVNRWLIFGSIVLTGVLTDVAANAFPGRTKSTSRSANGSHKHKSSKSSGPVGVLASPEQAPERTPEASAGDGGSDPSSESSAGAGSSAGEGSSGDGSSGEGSSGGETPSSEAQAPEPSSTPESSSEGQSSEPSGEASGPVVSGGS